MSIHNLYKHLCEVADFWEYKVLAGILAMIFTEHFFKLLVLFLILSLLDCYTRWCANSASLWKHMYPNTTGSLWIYTRRIYHTWCWRWISSAGLRQGFADKYMVYLLLIFAATVADSALTITHSPLSINSIVVTFLSVTEFISICENLSECGITFVSRIRDLVKEKVKV